jgi:amidase
MDPTWIVRFDAPGDGPRLAVKDCIDVEALPTTAGCQVVAEQARPAAADAPVVAAARRAGARIAGLKTTWGRVPLDGVYPLASSMDTVGPPGA